MTQPIQKYESNAVVVQARLVGAGSIDSIAKWCGGKLFSAGSYHPTGIEISTLEGEMKAPLGYWVIKGTEGEFYPCKDSVFQRKYHEYNETLKPVEIHFDVNEPGHIALARVRDWLEQLPHTNPHIRVADVHHMIVEEQSRLAVLWKQQETADESFPSPGEGGVDEVAIEQPTQQIIHIHNGGTVVINNPEVL